MILLGSDQNLSTFCWCRCFERRVEVLWWVWNDRSLQVAADKNLHRIPGHRTCHQKWYAVRWGVVESQGIQRSVICWFVLLPTYVILTRVTSFVTEKENRHRHPVPFLIFIRNGWGLYVAVTIDDIDPSTSAKFMCRLKLFFINFGWKKSDVVAGITFLKKFKKRGTEKGIQKSSTRFHAPTNLETVPSQYSGKNYVNSRKVDLFKDFCRELNYLLNKFWKHYTIIRPNNFAQGNARSLFGAFLKFHFAHDSEQSNFFDFSLHYWTSNLFSSLHHENKRYLLLLNHLLRAVGHIICAIPSNPWGRSFLCLWFIITEVFIWANRMHRILIFLTYFQMVKICHDGVTTNNNICHPGG